MSAENTIISEVYTVGPDWKVGDAIDLLDKKGVRAVPVVDNQNKLLGMLSTHQLIKNLLPVSATMEDGLQRLSFVIGAAPGVAKRLRSTSEKKVSEVMAKDIVVVHPETPTWEALRLLTLYGSPLPVVTSHKGTLVGIISEQSALEELRRLGEEMESDDSEDNDEFSKDN